MAQVVPDTWHIVNDQDVVVHGLKMFGWYKRNGGRVLVNKYGDAAVRPSLLELSLLQVRYIEVKLLNACCRLGLMQ